MNKQTHEINGNVHVKVTLKRGREMTSESGYAPTTCGSCEDSTSNQTQATCCY